LAIPWALKFLWAPLVDRYGSARFGRRKTWIVPLQLASALILTLLAAGADQTPLRQLLVAVFLLNLVAATQDIATDGLAVDMLRPHERGFANGLQVAGYRVGMIVGGGALLILNHRLGSSGTFLTMAALTIVATLPIVFAAEPPRAAPDASASDDRLHFLRRPGVARLLLLIVTYKAGDAFASSMLRPFLVDAGLNLEDIGWLLGSVGFLAGLLGALSGGALVNRLGRKPSLIIFGLLQALSVAGYAYLAAGAPTRSDLYALCAAEHFAGGMATAALFTCMMDWSSEEASATDYTVQASAVVIATGAAAAVAGFSAQALGYPAHFALGGLLALCAVLLVHRNFPSDAVVAQLRSARRRAIACA
jgi:predicted MFS family arabinose efflux permease